MKRTKITVRIDPDLIPRILARAAKQHRGLSNMLEALICSALRLPRPRPDRPFPDDRRYTANPRPR